MPTLSETPALILVGALWGCTNPLLRKGSSEAKSSFGHAETTAAAESSDPSSRSSDSFARSFFISSLSKFLHFRVWLPYLLNQSGSLLFYYALSKSDLSLAVPICNALALIFSIFTSFALGERVDKPARAIVGGALVMGGVTLCLSSRSS